MKEFVNVDEKEILEFLKLSTEIIDNNSKLTLDILQLMLSLMNAEDIDQVKTTILKNSESYLNEYKKLTNKYSKYNKMANKFNEQIKKD